MKRKLTRVAAADPPGDRLSASVCFSSRSLVSSVAFLLLGILWLCSFRSAQAQWEAGKSPMMSRWAQQVSPDKTLAEYPRPQMIRDQWATLNGLWDYAITSRSLNQSPTNYGGKILVPYPVESALSGVMKSLNTNEWLWCHRTFGLPKAWAGKRIRLNIGASDWETVVMLNGSKVGEHRGGYDSFSFDITPFLKANALQELIIRIGDETDGARQPVGRQSRKPGGMFHPQASGLWQTVWLEPTPKVSIEKLLLLPDVDKHRLRLTVHTLGAATNILVSATVLDGTNEPIQIVTNANVEFSIPIPNPKLWSPDHPYLYPLEVTLIQGMATNDSVRSYFGMRKVEVAALDGWKRVLLNGKPIIQMGVMDQGFWPDGIYTAPSDEALKSDLVAAKNLGFNMIRKHAKVEPERWYYWADKLGLLVWQDMPGRTNPIDPAGNLQFESELTRMATHLGNHPSIITWVLFNDGWGRFDAERLATGIKALDPTRLLTLDSGDSDAEIGDFCDIHSYPQPSYPASTNKVRVLGGYSVGALPTAGHVWNTKGARDPWLTSTQDLVSLYGEFADQVRSCMITNGLQAAVYAQLTDVEEEHNGLITYDRQVCKVDIASIQKINAAVINAPRHGFYSEVIPTSEKPWKGESWRFKLTPPDFDWSSADYNDLAWPQGEGAFGTNNAQVRTAWNSQDIWIRKKFHLNGFSTNETQRLVLRIKHGGDAEFYLNGVSACLATGASQIYRYVEITPGAINALIPNGMNALSFHCKKTGAGQFIDAGLCLRNPPPEKPSATQPPP